MKSIMQDKKECYICRMMYGSALDLTDRNLEEHHVFGGNPNRMHSERNGLKVWLCHEHHRTGKSAVHKSKYSMDAMHRLGQEAFEREHSRKEFVDIFGRNYIP